MKTRTGINGLRSVDFGVPDLEAAARFYEDIWGLKAVSTTADRVYLRGTGPDFYILALHRHPEPRMLRIDLSIESRRHADTLHAQLVRAGLDVVMEPGTIADPGGGYGFSFRDPVEGRVFRVIADAARHADTADQADLPRKLSHIVLNSPDREARFFVEQLGFRVIDKTRTITFLNCNDDHHSLALYTSEVSSFNHLAFEMRDLNSVMSATANMVEHGEEIGWGVGRHGPCDNVFCYFIGPGGFTIEYTAEVEQVDETYKVGGPEDWKFRRGRRDQWGLALPSPRMRSADTEVPFSSALIGQ
ncbi:VOC family protein [Caballeronia sp. AZ7_KS35]|uniref:VOC family protein n=1 Tax=Caballeronia sp. AZ7_KS35 TaxID=2921762 RepID=UPI0020283E19|nr:VOC family protein [Caballeronia sp. AZ7_KS35]